MKVVAVLAAALPVAGVASVAVLAGAAGQPDAAAQPTATDMCTRHGESSRQDLDPTQLHNAAVINAVGQRLGVPPPGEVVAIATALQESGLRNVSYGDRDSLGLFQQRPSQGWGSPADVMDPAHAATSFYQRLVVVPGWQQLPLTVAAQAVQRSAFPTAYAKWQTEATALVRSFDGGGGTVRCTPATTSKPSSPPPTASPAATIAIRFALSQLGKPYEIPPHPPSTWDCSSLVQTAYAAANIALPRVTYEQVRDSGPAISLQPQAWRPGDLLFTMGDHDHGSRVGHVGLYLGDGYVVEAPHTGADVRVTPLDSYGRVVAVTRPWRLPRAK